MLSVYCQLAKLNVHVIDRYSASEVTSTWHFYHTSPFLFSYRRSQPISARFHASLMSEQNISVCQLELTIRSYVNTTKNGWHTSQCNTTVCSQNNVRQIGYVRYTDSSSIASPMFPFRSSKTVKSGINIHVRVVCLNIVKFLSKIILLMFISFLPIKQKYMDSNLYDSSMWRQTTCRHRHPPWKSDSIIGYNFSW